MTQSITPNKIEAINGRLNSTDWNQMENLSANDAYIYFNDKLQSIVNSIVRGKSVEITKQQVRREPWMTKGLINSSKLLSQKVQKTNQTEKITPAKLLTEMFLTKSLTTLLWSNP